MSFTNPAPGGVQGRTDQGVDWSNIRGNIGAVAGGVITNVYQGLSGFGTLVVERIRGSAPVYYGLETGGGPPVVQPGERVRAGQEIAPGLGTGGIEVGYWNPATGHAAGYQPGVTSGGSTPAGRAFLSQLRGGRGIPRATPSSVNVPGYVPKQYRGWVSQAAQDTGLPASVVAAQIQDESSFDPSVTSNKGAEGIAQFEPSTFKSLGIKGSPYNPQAAQQAYVKYMNQLLRQYNGNIRDALSAYNSGGLTPAGYVYADTILSNAGISQRAKAGAKTPITRPGGDTTGSSDTGQGVEQLFANYEAELQTPRTAPPNVNPFQYWWASFTNTWEADTGGSSGG